MKNEKEIKSKLNELYLVRKALEKENPIQKEQLTAVNNQIFMLRWVLGKVRED